MSGLRLAAATLLAVVVTGSTGAEATPRIDTPLLSFALSSVEEPMGLCATDLQGHTFRLTGPPRTAFGVVPVLPKWSPDGSRLGFLGGPTTLKFVDADGTERGSESWWSGDGEHSSAIITGFAWSPDNRTLAVVVRTGFKYGGEESTLWVRGSRSISVYSGRGILGLLPSWSPDGSRIAFSNSFTRTAYVVDMDGQNLHEVMDGADDPVWSPDGQKLAYVEVDPENHSVGLAVARADGNGRRRLTAGRVLSPSWSPDGNTIAFVRDLGSSSEIEVIKVDGTGERVVVDRAASFPGPAWSPGGDAIAYTSLAEPSGVRVVDPDGTNERIVETGLPGSAASLPAWRAAAPLPTHRRRCVIAGTPEADVLRGTSRGDVIYGDAGNDRIYGGGRHDVIFGGAGRDELHGAAGSDDLDGGPGHDRLFGGPGNDFFMTADGVRDWLFGGAEMDIGSYDLRLDRHKSVERYWPR